ncbi:hypothetical protein QEN19_001904 [Hanseniaspora menglaensis]
MSAPTEAITDTVSNPLQDISLNVSYSLIHDSSPRNGTLKIKIHDVPENLLKATENSRIERSKKPENKLPLSNDELLLKQIIHIATMRTVNHLQRKFTDILKEMRSVSRDSFENLKVLNTENFAKILSEHNGGTLNITEEECGICLEKYELDSSNASEEALKKTKKRALEDNVDEENYQAKRRKLDSSENFVSESNETNESNAIENVAEKVSDDVNIYSHEPVLLTNCNHIFGRNCLYSWCSDNNSCPLCRQKISSKNVEYSMQELNQVLQDDQMLTSINYNDLLAEANQEGTGVLHRSLLSTGDDNERSSLFIVSGNGPAGSDTNNAERPYLTDPRLQTLIERTLSRLSDMLRDRENALRNRNDESSVNGEVVLQEDNFAVPLSEGIPPRIRIAEMSGNEQLPGNTGRSSQSEYNPILPQILSEFLRAATPTPIANTDIVNSNSFQNNTSSTETSEINNGSASTSEDQSNRNLSEILRNRVREMMNMVSNSNFRNETTNTESNANESIENRSDNESDNNDNSDT